MMTLDLQQNHTLVQDLKNQGYTYILGTYSALFCNLWLTAEQTRTNDVTGIFFW